MGNERVCIYIPVEEYRELVRAQRDAELLKAILSVKAANPYSMSKEETVEICKMFNEMGDEE